MGLGFVPWYTTVAGRRFRAAIALIDVDLEEGLVADSNGRVRATPGLGVQLEFSRQGWPGLTLSSEDALGAFLVSQEAHSATSTSMNR
jgi:hypothetical protein